MCILYECVYVFECVCIEYPILCDIFLRNFNFVYSVYFVIWLKSKKSDEKCMAMCIYIIYAFLWTICKQIYFFHMKIWSSINLINHRFFVSSIIVFFSLLLTVFDTMRYKRWLNLRYILSRNVFVLTNIAVLWQLSIK